MTDDEYKEYLVALARRHLKQSWLLAPGPDTHVLGPRIERLSAACRLLREVADRSDNDVLVQELTKELHDIHLESVVFEMERAGVLDALDETPELTLGEIRRSVIPDEDSRLLGSTGIPDPEAEITLLVHFARARFGVRGGRDRDLARLPSESAHEAAPVFRRAVERLEALTEKASRKTQESPKPRKLFAGIGKLIAGTVTAAGNLLLATGSIIAPNPATAYGVIGSSALAIASICQGIGDLRGE